MVSQESAAGVTYPLDPLESVTATDEYRRSLVSGVLESYNSNYDFLAEAVQNAIDALEDAKLCGLSGPFRLAVTIDLEENHVSVLDTGVGMTEQDLARALAPHVSLKSNGQMIERRGMKHSYRGYKGVGLTLLAYGTDDLRLHSKPEGEDLVALRMRYGNEWARGARQDSALVDRDRDQSPLRKLNRGTFVRMQFSASTRPRSLRALTPHTSAWEAILRTRTAIGQVLIMREPLVEIEVSLTVIDSSGDESVLVAPRFLFPHDVQRNPPFRFLDIGHYYESHPQVPDIPDEFKRQDGIFVFWDTEMIRSHYGETEREKFRDQLDAYNPTLYAFVAYQGGVWGEMNELLAKSVVRSHLSPGLVLAINRQRLADVFPIGAKRYETFSHNVLVAVHFDNARPDQGRKTVQDEVLEAAKAAANQAVQYLASQRSFLRPTGEIPSAQQRQVERNKQDWEFNVRKHQERRPLDIPPVTFGSEPLTEQDVVGLFHQLSALGVFPGIHILATSQTQTYDSLIFFKCDSNEQRLRASDSTLGLAPSVLGAGDMFETRNLTLEFKNNLDGLISDIDDENRPKQYQHIDVCVCWGTVEETFTGYELNPVGPANLDQRRYPGTTHLLQRDGESHTIEVIMLSTVRDLVESGDLPLA
ncbi:MAG: ATP-binding protein [Chloroflexi bacterium]|nr:ATP-binding protein [Chloroflexota bacterium]